MSSEIFEAAAKIANPYALAAFAVAGIVALLLKLFPKISTSAAAKILHSVVKYSFSLGVLALVFSFVLALVNDLSDAEEVGRLSETKVEISARNETLERILRRCADQAGLALALDPSFEGSVRMSLQAQGKLSGILDNVCEVGNCAWQVEPGPQQPVLFVRAAETKPQDP